MTTTTKRARQRLNRVNKPAIFDVFCPGVLEVLSIGKGDIKLNVGDNDKDRAEAKRIIDEMLRLGYSLFVETDEGPVRVMAFNPNRMSYSVAAPALPAPPEQKALPPGSARPKATRGPRKGTREVPVAGTRTTAVGRTAGG